MMIPRFQIVVNERGLTSLRFHKYDAKTPTLELRRGTAARWQACVERELRAYLAGRLMSFTVPYDISPLPSFTRAVLKLTAEIPYGEVRSYEWVARKLRKPKAARAVGNALARNPLPIIIPCHRVVRRDGTTGKFLLGSRSKQRLLNLEKRFAKTKTSLESSA
jgi:methylated-DNA-[protein]-cysteine S-methyltransferase